MVSAEPVGSPPCVILAAAVKLRFGAFELDQVAGELRRSGTLVRLQPQPFKVLSHLATRPGVLVSREELRALIWGEQTFVEFERGLNFAVSRVRAALGDSARAPRFLETVPRRGYRFVAPVTVLDAPAPALLDASGPPRRLPAGALTALVLLVAGLIGAKPAARAVSARGGMSPRLAAAQAAYDSARALCGADGWRRSIPLYAEALRLDARFAAAHVGMARSYAALGENALLDPDQAFPAARRASAAALALEDSAEARLVRGSVLLDYDWDWAGAGRDLTRAVALAPRSAQAWARLARFRSVAGDDDGAVAAARRAEALDPGDEDVREELASCLKRARRPDESARVWRRLADRRGISSHHALFSIFRNAGRDAEALDEARLAMEAARVPADRIAAVIRLGPVAGARAYLNGTIAFLTRSGNREPVAPERLAVLCAQLGETGRALDRLEEALAARSPSLLAALRDPDLDALRREPRFRGILDAVGHRPPLEPIALVAFAAPPAVTRRSETAVPP